MRLQAKIRNGRRCIFVSRAQVNEASGENAFRYDETMSGASVYNYYRDYDSGTGRYIESDPIGTVLFRDMAFRNLGRISLVAPELGDFLNSERPKYAFSYTYVKSNPLSYTDPLGLLENACTPTPQATSSNLILVAAGGGSGGCTWTGFSVPSIDSYTGKGTVKCQYRCPDGSLQYRTHSSILGCPQTALF